MSEKTEKYYTLKKKGEFLYKEKGSKFLGHAIPCPNADSAKAEIKSLRESHPNAVHVCFAWRFGLDDFEDRYSDDGEPNNSAGKPIFGQIINADITNVLIAVVRYYGGTKLGVGGLISAYKTAAEGAISDSGIIEKELTYTYLLRYDYADTGQANILLAKNQTDIIENGFDDQGPFIKFAANKEKLDLLKIQIEELKSLVLIQIV